MSASTPSVRWPLFVLTTLFFMWGFMTVMNDVLIPHLKAVFALNWFQSMLVQSSFFGAYFLGSAAYFTWSRRSGDPIQRLGYKRGLIAGLFLSALGSALFVPATHFQVYGAYLLALFVLGLGFTLLQIAANPFVSLIGEPSGASSRLNLAQAFNSLGTTLAPVVGGTLIFHWFAGTEAVRWPYLAFALLLLMQAFWVLLTPLPEPAAETAPVKADAWRHGRVRRGMAAIFCYVGTEVAIGSLIIGFAELPSIAGLSPDAAKTFLSLYWGGAMVGRFLGAVSLSPQLPLRWRTLLMLGLGAALFVLLWAINSAESAVSITTLAPMLLLILFTVFLFRSAGSNAGRTLALFGTMAFGLLVAAVLGSGPFALWALVAVGLFNSIQWSNIFTLAIRDLGNDTAQASSLLVMMIVGGAILPALLGLVADGPLGLQRSFLLLLPCYAYIAWFGWRERSPHQP